MLVKKDNLISFLFFCTSLTLLFGRSLMGVYIFKFRIGEIIVGSSLLITVITIFLLLKNNLYKTYNFAFLLINFSYLLTIYITNTSILSLYTYKTSSYIFSISWFYIFAYFIGPVQLNKKVIRLLEVSLLLSYVLSTVFFPNFLIEFFTKYSDKFDFTKASTVALLFIITMYFSNRHNFVHNKNFYYFFFITSLFLPLFSYKSRGSFLAIIIFTIFEIFKIKDKIKKPIILLKLLLPSIFILIFSSFNIANTDVEIKNASEDLIWVLSEVVTVKDSSQNESFYKFYIDKGRLNSYDGNLNWRLQIWQDVIDDSIDDKKIIFGNGYKDIIPAMNDKSRQGIDGTNENVHNFIINIFARGGIVQLISYLLFIYLIIFENKLATFKLLGVVLPIFIISFFDSSMENAHFPILFYLFLGLVFSNNLIFQEIEKNNNNY